MKLIQIAPKKLLDNPSNPRRTAASAEADATLLANVKAVGILQPPIAREVDGKVVLIAGHRRRDAAIAAKLDSIHVLVREPEDDLVEDADDVRAYAENSVRANMTPVDNWRAIEAMVGQNWNDETIAVALNITPRHVRVYRHLTHIHPAMLNHMARGDMPSEQQLRVIGLATTEEQASVWKKNKPKKNEHASWHTISAALDKRRISAAIARFGEAEIEAFGVSWEDDLFVPAGQESRYTTQADAFLQAQRAWLEVNVPEGGILIEVDEWSRPVLPPRAHQVYYSKPGPSDTVGYYVNPRTCDVDHVVFRKPEPTESRRPSGDASNVRDTGLPKVPRPDLTPKGEAMVGDLRTEALHAAFTEAEIGDDTLIGLLVLALAGENVKVQSGVRGDDIGHGQRGSLAAAITEGGVLTADPAALRAAARGMLRQALSCRVGFSSSGRAARVAGIAVDADAWLPTTATEEFLGNLSKAAIERTATATGVAPRNTGKATRAAIVEQLKGRTFLHPLVCFDFTDTERRQAEADRAREAERTALRRGGHAADEDDAGDEVGMENPEHLLDGDEGEGPEPGVMPPPGEVGAPTAHAV
ncbi:MAG: ParB N-terminal domain-containing protein [Roseomonas mucosa]|nr:ParB N-terminal domain-containing protein [Roseomonas mucosa]